MAPGTVTLYMLRKDKVIGFLTNYFSIWDKIWLSYSGWPWVKFLNASLAEITNLNHQIWLNWLFGIQNIVTLTLFDPLESRWGQKSLSFFFLIFFLIVCVWMFPLNVCIPAAHEGQGRALDLELELHYRCLRHHVVVENWTLVIWKSKSTI